MDRATSRMNEAVRQYKKSEKISNRRLLSWISLTKICKYRQVDATNGEWIRTFCKMPMTEIVRLQDADEVFCARWNKRNRKACTIEFCPVWRCMMKGAK